jgi:hypothetical protein
LLARKTHAFQHAVAIHDRVGHGIERTGKILNFVAASQFGARPQVAARHLSHHALQRNDGFHQPPGLRKRNHQAQDGAQDGQ